uniref:Uncharacterized protein n=1 Tax=Anguilla anguilla TaxID=7936 RepID=A0A0E9RZW6_ANGAN
MAKTKNSFHVFWQLPCFIGNSKESTGPFLTPLCSVYYGCYFVEYNLNVSQRHIHI